MVILDTNVYLDAERDSELGEQIAEFVAGHGEIVGLSSVVLAELLIGARSAAARERIIAATLGATDAEYVLTPTQADWHAAGDALAALGGGQATKGRSFWNDLLLAISCARVGATVVTRNADDFRRIQRVVDVAVAPRPT